MAEAARRLGRRALCPRARRARAPGGRAQGQTHAYRASPAPTSQASSLRRCGDSGGCALIDRGRKVPSNDVGWRTRVGETEFRKHLGLLSTASLLVDPWIITFE